MKKLLSILGIVALIVVIGSIVLVGPYNKLITMNEEVNSQWAQVENQLQRRADLIPNLVNTVQGYAQHEKSIFQAVADARTKLAGANGVQSKAEANNQLSTALSKLLLVVENYPNLKADQNFRALQDELAGTENRLAVARRDYNNSVQQFNAKVKFFPTNIYANILGFQQREYFKAAPTAQNTPQVKF